MADAKVTFEGDASSLERALQAARSKLRQFEKDLPTKSVDMLRQSLAGLGITLTAGAVLMGLRSVINTLDDLEDAAESAATTTQTLTALRYAASFAGVGADELDKALTQLSTKLVDAAGGSKEAQLVFERMGIKIRNSAGQLLQTDEALAQIADRFATYKNTAERTALAAEIFGQKIGPKLVPFLVQGSAGIQQLKEEAEKLGLVIGDQAVSQASRLADEIDRLKMRFEAVKIELGTAVIPFILKTVEEFNAATKATGSFIGALGLLIRQSAQTLEDPGKKIAKLRADIEELQKNLAAKEGLPIYRAEKQRTEERIANIRREIGFLQELQRNRINAANADRGDNLDARDLRAMRGGSGVIAPVIPRGAPKKPERLGGFADEFRDLQRIRENRARIAAEIEEEEAKRVERSAEVAQQYLARQSELMTSRLEAVQAALMTEEEIERASYTSRLQVLIDALEQGRLTEEQYRVLREQAEIDHQARLNDVWAQGLQARQKFLQQSTVQQTQTVVQGLLAMTSAVATSSRAMFEINKAAGIANAIVNTYQGVTKALAAYPPPINFVMAAATLAAGLAQVQQIRSAQFGMSTSAPSIAGGQAIPVESTGPTAVEPTGGGVAASRSHRMEITLVGDSFTRTQIRELIQAINEQVGNGVDLVISGA